MFASTSLASLCRLSTVVGFSAKKQPTIANRCLINCDTNEFKSFKRATNRRSTVTSPRPVISSDKKVSKSQMLGVEDDECEEKEFIPYVVAKHHPQYYLDLCMKLGSQGKIADAVAVVEKRMYEDRVRPEKYNYAGIIHLLGQSGFARKAMEFFRKMRIAGFEPSPPTITSLINACANAPAEDRQFAIDQTRWLLQRQKHVHGQISKSAVFFAAMKCYARHGETEATFRLADEMITAGWPLDARIFAYLLSSAWNDKESGFHLAMQLWKIMRKLKIRPSSQNYRLLLKICKECGVGQKGNATLRSLIELQRKQLFLSDHCEKQSQCDSSLLKIDESKNASEYTNLESDDHQGLTHVQKTVNSTDVESYSIFNKSKMLTCETDMKLSLLGGFDDLLISMEKDRVIMDMKLCATLLYVAPNSLTSEETLLAYVEKKKIKIDTPFINLLAFRRAMRRETEATLVCLDIFRRQRLMPDVRTFAALSFICKTTHQGLTLLRDMSVLNLKPTVVIFHNLLKNATFKYFNFVYIQNILGQMHRHDVRPNKSMLVLLEDKLSKFKQELLEKQMNESNNDNADNIEDSNADKTSIRFHNFLEFYENWLQTAKLHVEPSDWRLTEMNKKINVDDLREEWEKPWSKEQEKEKEKFNRLCGALEVVP